MLLETIRVIQQDAGYPPIRIMRIPLKKIFWRTSVSLVAVYLLAFAVLAHFGGYVMVPSGANIAPGGYAINDMLLWQPRFGTYLRCHFYDADFLGRLFAPPIILHQRFFRPTILLNRTTRRLPSRAELHPQFRQQLDEVEAMIHMKWEDIIRP